MNKRRTHKKSRLGCQGCKRRHIKCDETRPTCKQCSLVERVCEYQLLAPRGASPFPTPTSSATPYPADASDTNSERAGSSTLRNSTPAKFQSLSPSWLTAVPASPSLTTSWAAHDAPLNMRHMELLSHFIIENACILEGNTPLSRNLMRSVMPIALSTPYLMHQTLALSAMHLSHTTPNEAESYQKEATALQTQALSIFNDSVSELTAENCVPMFMFTSFLGLHALADFVKSQQKDEEALLDKFIGYLNLHRGVSAVTNNSWETLTQSRISPILDLARASIEAAFLESQERANSITMLLYELMNHVNMNADSEVACRDAIARLKMVYQTQSQGEGLHEKSANNHLIWAWPILVSRTFTNLLMKRQPEALVILCYYAILLHERRDMWLVGNTGSMLIRAITRSLGSYWKRWLELPYEVLGETA